MTDPDLPAVIAPERDERLGERVVAGGTIRMVGFGVSNVVAIGASLVLLRHLGVEGFGKYGAVMALMSIVQGVTDAGLSISGTRELALLDPDRRERFTRDVLGIRLVLATVGVAIALLVGLGLGFGPTMMLGTAVAGIGVIAISATAALTMKLLVSLQNARLTLVEVARQVVQLVATVAFALIGAGLLAFFGVQALAGLAGLLVLPWVAGRGSLLLPRYDRKAWREIAHHALPVAIAGTLLQIYLKVLVLIGFVALSEYDSGLFVASTRAVEVLTGMPMLIVLVVLPVVSVAAREDRGRLRYVAQRLLEAGLILGILIALPLSIAAHTVLLVLGGPQFTAGSDVLSIQAWMLLTVFIVQGCIVLLVALERRRDIVIANGVGLVIVVALGVVLLPLAGARGGAIAAVAADTLLALLMLAMVWRSGLGPELSVGALPRIVLAGLAGVAAGVLVPGPDYGSAVAAVAVYLVALIGLRALPPEVGSLVRGYVPRAAAAPLASAGAARDDDDVAPHDR